MYYTLNSFSQALQSTSFSVYSIVMGFKNSLMNVIILAKIAMDIINKEAPVIFAVAMLWLKLS